MTRRTALSAATCGRISRTSVRCCATSRCRRVVASPVGVFSPSQVVVTDAGGFGVLVADAVDQFKMKLVDFAPSTVTKFKATFPPYYQCANPMDLTGSAKTNDMLQAGHLALEDPNIDAVVFGLQPIAPGLADADVMAKKLVEEFGPGKTKKPFVVVEWGGKYPDDRTIRTILKESGMAVYPGAEEALRVLSKLAGYQEYLNDRKSITTEVGEKRELYVDVFHDRYGGRAFALRQGGGEGSLDADGSGGLRRVLALRHPHARL